MYSAPNGAATGSNVTPIAADIELLGPPWKIREGLRRAQNSTPQMAALMPKCGGTPARVTEKATACGMVTSASVRLTTRLPLTCGQCCQRMARYFRARDFIDRVRAGAAQTVCCSETIRSAAARAAGFSSVPAV